MGNDPFLFVKAKFFEIESPLLEFRNNVASQFGEDGIVQRIFELLPDGDRNFVEFGAWDGKFLSNCWHLAENLGWAGVFIEGNEGKFKELLDNHGENQNIKCLNKFIELSGENTLDNILSGVGMNKNFDLLSIDVDGTDYFIWESLSEFLPRLVIIEFNPTVPNDIIFVQAKDANVNHGCSLLALVTLGKQKGYELVCCTSTNAFFVRKEEFHHIGLSNNSHWNLYEPICDGRIFQGYDSTIFVEGMDRLVWKGGWALESSDFQVLPKSARVFGDNQKR